MPILYWYFPMIIFSGVCDLVSPPHVADGVAFRASSPTQYSDIDDDADRIDDDPGPTFQRVH
jgi:hypothetical protein